MKFKTTPRQSKFSKFRKSSELRDAFYIFAYIKQNLLNGGNTNIVINCDKNIQKELIVLSISYKDQKGTDSLIEGEELEEIYKEINTNNPALQQLSDLNICVAMDYILHCEDTKENQTLLKSTAELSKKETDNVFGLILGDVLGALLPLGELSDDEYKQKSKLMKKTIKEKVDYYLSNKSVNIEYIPVKLI